MENQKESIICVTGRAQEGVVPDIARLNVTIQSVNINYLHLYQLAQDNLAKLGKIAEERGLYPHRAGSQIKYKGTKYT